MLYLGFLFIVVAAGTVVYSECEKMKKRSLEYTELLSLLVCLKGAVATGRKTPKEAVASFLQRGSGSNIPWLVGMEDGERVSSFFREKRILSSQTQLFEEDKAALADFFFEIGMYTADRERERVDKIILRIEKKEEELRRSTQNNTKAAWILFLSASLGLFIIIL